MIGNINTIKNQHVLKFFDKTKFMTISLDQHSVNDFS